MTAPANGVLLVLALLLSPGCKKDAPAETGQPPQPAAGQPGQPGPASPGPQPGQPAAGTPASADPAALPAKPDSDNATAEAPAAPAAPDRLERPRLPEPPTDNLLLVIRAAEVGCRADEPVCAARDALAAKIPTELEAVKSLMDSGTDQQKLQLRLALQRARDPKADALLAAVMIAANGATDMATLAHGVALRTEALVAPILERLKKANGDEAVALIDALAAIGSKSAVEGLRAALADQRLAPYSGETCRALARVADIDSLDAIKAIGSRLNATQRQAMGCRGAEAALRMLRALGDITWNVDGKRQATSRVLVHQDHNNPMRIRLSLVHDRDAKCAAASSAETVFYAPLDRAGDAIVGQGIAGSLIYKGKDLGTHGSYLLRFDTLEMKTGSPLSGVLHHSHTRKGDPHVVISGRFTGNWCGVSPK